MSQLQKRCFIGSAGVHLLLVVILFVGPAFFSGPPKVSDVQELYIVPTRLVDQLIASGGGSPHASPTPPAPTPPRLQTPPAEPRRAEIEPVTREMPSLEPAKDRKKLPKVSTTLVTRTDKNKEKKKSSTVDTEQRQMADARRRAQELIRSTTADLRQGSATTEIGDFGHGAGGETYASYAAWILSVYENAWVVPEDASSDDATAKVSITIASDGRVVSSRLIKSSGDAQMDASVQRTLDRVTSVGRPFPEGARDKERTYIIPSNMKNKQGRA